MQVTSEKLEKSEVKLTIELTAEEFEPYRKKAAEQLGKEVEVDGFRKGEVPMDVLINKIGEQAFMGHVLDLAIGESYENAVKQEKLMAIDYPRIQIQSHDPLKYEAIVPTLPEVKWGKDPKGLKVERQEQKVEDDEIEEVLGNLKDRTKKWKEVERGAKSGDKVELDFDGYDAEGGDVESGEKSEGDDAEAGEPKPLEGTSSKNHPLIIGSDSFIPGFEEKLEGIKAGEEKDIELTFPKDYHAEHFKGKKVRFHVKAHKVEEPEEHELDDEFAKMITGGNRKTMDELKEEIVEELKKQKEVQELGRLENDFLTKLAEYVDIEIPQSLIDREKEMIIARMKKDMQARGVKWEDYEKEMTDKGKDMQEELTKPATQQVKIRLGLEKLYEENPLEAKLDVTEEEIDKEVADMLAHYPKEFAPMVEARYKKGEQERESLRNRLMLRKITAAHTK
jgi:trigger factor